MYFPYGLNTEINDINLMKIFNVYHLFCNFDETNTIKRGKNVSRKFTKCINYVIPNIWIKNMKN